MTAVLPKSAPFSADEISTLNALVGRATPLQRSWLAGFLAGLDAAAGPAAVATSQPPRPKARLTILYASESGNAEGLAMKARKLAQKQGFNVRILDMGDADVGQLKGSDNIVVYASTWGEGDPPQRSVAFYKSLMADGAPKLDGVRFAVLALGDTAYVNFCSTGKAIDARLEELGASRAADRVDLDLDYAKKAAGWTEATLQRLTPADDAASTRVVHVDFKSAAHADEDDAEPAFDAQTPLSAEITQLVNLNGTGSSSETWHVEFSTEDPRFVYQPGDAIGVVPENDAALVADLAGVVGLQGDAALAATLATKFDVTTLTRPVVEAYAKLTGRADVAKLAAPEAFAAWSGNRQLVDLFAEHTEKLTADQLTGLLRPLPARLYSVASSLKAHAGETHLLVSAVRWASHGRERKGVASTFLADRRKVGQDAKLYVKANRHFRLPTDGNRPIVMIGAGTGVAPFRAFVEERAETSAKGKSWLFFGARTFTNDFLYQLEWQDHLKSGALSRIDVAFSRDQPRKVYVQQRLDERQAELKSWIEDGAHLYVCGDEKGLGRDVDATLTKMLGEARLEELRRAGRYQRDVY